MSSNSLDLRELDDVISRAEEELKSATIVRELESLQVKYLGKKGEVTAILRTMGKLPADLRPAFGAAVNDAKEKLSSLFDSKLEVLRAEELSKQFQEESIDVSLPGRIVAKGKVHPLNVGFEEITSVFAKMGFSVVEGPEVEWTYYNFDALNHSIYHPARDPQDTFYINDSVLLRTQTSPMQVRAMELQKPPVKVVVPGTVYRRDQVDATHSPVFHQLEGLYVDKNITFADLKGALTEFAQSFYGRDRKVRFRPHFFPFTEPSAEMDVSCMICGGTGCRVCKNEGWIEILGAGMVHPNVLKAAGYDPESVTGFAFGLGIERIVMLKYGIDDMRLLFENDLRFLSQF